MSWAIRAAFPEILSGDVASESIVELNQILPSPTPAAFFRTATLPLSSGCVNANWTFEFL